MDKTLQHKTHLWFILASTVAITFLFHKQLLGLNLVLMELLLLGYLVATKQFRLQGRNNLILGTGVLSSLVFTLVTHSVFAYIMHFISLLIFVGVLIYPDAKSLITSTMLGLMNLGAAQGAFFAKLRNTQFRGFRIGQFLWRSRIFTIPILIIFVFLGIYSLSNPVFDALLGDITTFIAKQWNLIFRDLDLSILFTLIVGLLLSNFILLREPNAAWIGEDERSSDFLVRKRQKHLLPFRFSGLKSEYRAGVFLLITLNAILLTVNVIDVNWVWFHFDWQAQDLKQFVHSGTYLLILSILISVGIVAYYFRGNLNFLANNRLLKILSFVWLGQNALLAVSVAIRNFYYISYYSLAYKRIGVIIFLLLTVYGLYTVFRKVQGRKSVFYVLRANVLAMYIVLTISSFVNWDVVIAQYNFSNPETSFIHYDFLASLSDKALPYLEKTEAELAQFRGQQEDRFAFSMEPAYMTPEVYKDLIQIRIKYFLEYYEQRNLWEWNLPDYLAYQRLKATR